MKPNLKDFDYLNRKEAELFSHEIERQKARAFIHKYLGYDDLSEFYKESKNDRQDSGT